MSLATKYVYNNTDYYLLSDLYKAIWDQQRIEVKNVITQQGFEQLGLDVQFVQYDPLELVDIDTLKQRWLVKLENAFNDYRNSKNTNITSSLGFKVNANETAYANVDGVVLQARKQGDEVPFMDFDDQLQMLDQQQLETLQLEISENGSAAYNKKWAYRQRIEAASSYEDLKQITDFTFE